LKNLSEIEDLSEEMRKEIQKVLYGGWDELVSIDFSTPNLDAIFKMFEQLCSEHEIFVHSQKPA
jgi:hypothetical protein